MNWCDARVIPKPSALARAAIFRNDQHVMGVASLSALAQSVQGETAAPAVFFGLVQLGETFGLTRKLATYDGDTYGRGSFCFVREHVERQCWSKSVRAPLGT